MGSVLLARLLGAATHDFGWPLLAGGFVAVMLGGGLLLHGMIEDARTAGEESCLAAAVQESAETVTRLQTQVQAQTDAAAKAHAKILDAERRAAAAHRALDAERSAHNRTRRDACAAGCTVHLPPS